MNLSEIDYIQVIVRIRGKYHMVLLNESTKRMLPELIAGMEGKIRLLETEIPLEEISIEEMKRISEMSKHQVKEWIEETSKEEIQKPWKRLIMELKKLSKI